MTPAATARRRAWIVLTIVLLACAALAVTAGRRHPSVDIFLIGITGLILYLLPLLAVGRKLTLDDERYLTGRAVSGSRTVDLYRLVRITRFELPGRSLNFHLVELVDADGVRLVVDEQAGDRRVLEALERHLVNATIVPRSWSYLASVACSAPPAFLALVVHAVG